MTRGENDRAEQEDQDREENGKSGKQVASRFQERPLDSGVAIYRAKCAAFWASIAPKFTFSFDPREGPLHSKLFAGLRLEKDTGAVGMSIKPRDASRLRFFARAKRPPNLGDGTHDFSDF